jgi:hypothetical protein
MTALTATAIITAGYHDAQKVAVGASLTPAQMDIGLGRLNDLINLWQTQGLKLFLEEEVNVALVAAQQLYSMRPGGNVNINKPLQVKQATYWDSAGSIRPLNLLSRDEWTRLSNRTQQGSVNSFFAEKLYDRINLHLWHVPDATAATGSVKAVIRAQASNVLDASGSILFPPEWAIALRWGIADEVSFGMPEAIVAKCAARAKAFKDALEAWDVEEAESYFQPDPRNFGSGSRFR